MPLRLHSFRRIPKRPPATFVHSTLSHVCCAVGTTCQVAAKSADCCRLRRQQLRALPDRNNYAAPVQQDQLDRLREMIESPDDFAHVSAERQRGGSLESIVCVACTDPQSSIATRAGQRANFILREDRNSFDAAALFCLSTSATPCLRPSTKGCSHPARITPDIGLWSCIVCVLQLPN